MSKPITLIGSAEAEVMLGISRATLSRWVAAGKLATAGRLGGPNGALIFDKAVVRAAARQISRTAAAKTAAERVPA